MLVTVIVFIATHFIYCCSLTKSVHVQLFTLNELNKSLIADIQKNYIFFCEMDFFLNNNDKRKHSNSESRWNRIEKRHIHSIHRTDAASEICKNLIKNKDFIKERQLKALMGEDTIQWSLDPNRVMDLRHFNVSLILVYCLEAKVWNLTIFNDSGAKI